RVAEAKRIEGDWVNNVVSGMQSEIAEEAGFFKMMFSPIDGLFVLLALGTALKIGGGHDGD
ncbi:MAG TPA: hypothetical protein P5572_22005, partial [Phycisphaerae bacterium]|nr:hypothetical protein [Phycisphaerae bacterium]